MTIKTTTTPTGKTITVEIIRRVQDKIAYLDGYNLPSGREIVDITTITLRDASGKVLTSGNNIQSVSPRFDAKSIASGAVAKIGNAYLSQTIYDLAAGLLAEVEAETPKSDEQIAIETAKANAKKEHDAWYYSPEQVAARKFDYEMCRPDSDY
jgi:hypothetical protein